MLRMTEMLVALILSAAIVLLTGPKFIAWLRKLKLGQTIYELGPESHRKKQGTPIMGGLFIALGCVVAFVVSGVTLGAWDHMLALLFVALGSMAVGFGDDWIKMVKKRHEGLTPWQKIIGQAIVCVGFACYCYFHPEIGSEVHVPVTDVMWDLDIFYIPLLALTVLLYVYLRHSKQGYEISVVGESVRTAQYSGMNVKKIIVRTMLVSGLLCGLAGYLIGAGLDQSITTESVGGQGFTAIMVSWLGQFNPFIMAVVSGLLVFGMDGAAKVADRAGLNSSYADIVSGIVILFLVGCEFFIQYSVKLRHNKKGGNA